MSATVGEGTPLTANVPNAGTQTLTYTLPLQGRFVVESVVADIDASAAPATTPILRVLDKSGAVIATKRQGSPIPAADTGSATWALRLADDPAPVGAAGRIVKVSDHTLAANGTFAVANAFQAGFDYLEMHLWARLPTATYGAGPGTVRARFMSGGAVLNRWRLLAAGSFTNISAAGQDNSSAVGFVPQLPNTAQQRAAYSYTTARWFGYQSPLGYKDWISDGMTFDQTFNTPLVTNLVNRWTGGGWMEGTAYPGIGGNVALLVYPNANPSTTAGNPDAGTFAAGSRLLVLGYNGA